MNEATITWSPEDIVTAAELRGKDITIEQADAWLGRNAKHIRDRSTELGWDLIDTLLSMDSPTQAAEEER